MAQKPSSFLPIQREDLIGMTVLHHCFMKELGVAFPFMQPLNRCLFIITKKELHQIHLKGT